MKKSELQNVLSMFLTFFKSELRCSYKMWSCKKGVYDPIHISEDLPAIISGLEVLVADPKFKSSSKAKVVGFLAKLKDYRKLTLCVAYRELLETIVPASKVLEGKQFFPKSKMVSTEFNGIEV